MPHRPIDSRWVVTTNRFTSLRPGNIIRVIANGGLASNRVFNETTNRELPHFYELADAHVRPVEDMAPVPQNNQAPAPRPVFQPEPDERYFIVYKTTQSQDSIFIVWNRASTSDRRTNAHTMAEIEQAVQSGTFRGCDVIAVPARGVARWNNSVRDNDYVTIQEPLVRRA